MTTKQYVERDKNGRAKHLNKRNKSTIHFLTLSQQLPEEIVAHRNWKQERTRRREKRLQ